MPKSWSNASMTGPNGQIRMRKFLVIAPRALEVVLIFGNGQLSLQYKHQLLRHNGSTIGSEERDMSRTSASQDQLLFGPHLPSIHQTYCTLSSWRLKNSVLHLKLPESFWTTTHRCLLTQSLETGMKSRRCHLPMLQTHSPLVIAKIGEMKSIYYHWIVSIFNILKN